LFVVSTFETTVPSEKGFVGFPGFIVADLGGRRVVHYVSLAGGVVPLVP